MWKLWCLLEYEEERRIFEALTMRPRGRVPRKVMVVTQRIEPSECPVGVTKPILKGAVLFPCRDPAVKANLPKMFIGSYDGAPPWMEVPKYALKESDI